MVGRPSHRVGMGREALEEGGIGQDALPEIWEGLGGPGEVESPFLRAGRGQEALPVGREGDRRSY